MEMNWSFVSDEYVSSKRTYWQNPYFLSIDAGAVKHKQKIKFWHIYSKSVRVVQILLHQWHFSILNTPTHQLKYV